MYILHPNISYGFTSNVFFTFQGTVLYGKVFCFISKMTVERAQCKFFFLDFFLEFYFVKAQLHFFYGVKWCFWLKSSPLFDLTLYNRNVASMSHLELSYSQLISIVVSVPELTYICKLLVSFKFDVFLCSCDL